MVRNRRQRVIWVSGANRQKHVQLNVLAPTKAPHHPDPAYIMTLALRLGGDESMHQMMQNVEPGTVFVNVVVLQCTRYNSLNYSVQSTQSLLNMLVGFVRIGTPFLYVGRQYVDERIFRGSEWIIVKSFRYIFIAPDGQRYVFFRSSTLKECN